MKNNLTVSIIIPSFYPAVVYGGWVFSSLNTSKELAKLGILCNVSTTNDNGKDIIIPQEKAFIKVFDNIYVKYYYQNIRERFSLSMLLGLYKDIKQADIVHIQGMFSMPTPVGLFYAYWQKKKVVLSPHGCLGEWCMNDGSRLIKKPYLNFFVRPFLKSVVWHATSEQEKNEILALFPNANVAIIPNGIYADEFSKPNILTRQAYIQKFTGIENQSSKVIISMARLHKKKGFDVLIDAFAKSLQAYPDTVLLIAGEDFGEKNSLERQILQLNLSNKVFLIGQLSGQERIDFFAHADMFALASNNENFGLVYAEAMASGTPILASTYTPWQEVEDLKIGRWVPNTVQATAEGMIDLLGKDLHELGQKSKIFVSENYSWPSIGWKFKALFEKMTRG
ncbi:MAG: glycosyltransferase [Cytophagales bacterium]|nr:MAG: glycosyltransferase [Cytophagales bacterium]